MNNKAVFLDRDGVINKTIFRMGKPRAPYRLEELSIIDGVKESLDILRKAGFNLIVVTNQPDVARGWVDLSSVNAINAEIKSLLNIDEIKCCFHTEKDGCDCRKPQPGMLIEASLKYCLNLNNSFMVGDRYSDIAAGKAAGCATILVGEGDTINSFPAPDFKVTSLIEAIPWILSKKDQYE
jgi:D-glycero-D-manno-heptose 1,7-bisphosphate phosphatase